MNIFVKKKNMKNLEIKTRIDNFDSIQNKLSFAKNAGVLEQKDTYYLLGETQLKLREQNNISELILYTRPKVKESRESKYFRFSIPITLKNIFKKILSIIFGVKKIVEKERFLFLYKHTRIHLDKVKMLGNFIELETVFNKNIPDIELTKEHQEVKNLLGLEILPSISGSYSDLLVANKSI